MAGNNYFAGAALMHLHSQRYVCSTATICGCDNEMVSLFAANITIGAVKSWLAERLQPELLLNCDEALHVASVCLLIAFVQVIDEVCR